jgi:hypothetical protein
MVYFLPLIGGYEIAQFMLATLVKTDIELNNQQPSNGNIYKILDKKLKEIMDI